MNNLKKRRLGRGLEALLGATSEAAAAPDRPTGSLSDLMAAAPPEQATPAAETRSLKSPAWTPAVPTPSVVAPAPNMSATNFPPASFPQDGLPTHGSPGTFATAPTTSSRSTTPDASRLATLPFPSSGGATGPGSQDPRRAAEVFAPVLPNEEARVTSSASTTASQSALPAAEPTEGALLNLPVLEIQENPFQPRRVFSESEIASLSESLKEHDMLQPILVRIVAGQYQLISGERRLRAAIQAGWKTIPARVREADDRLVAELAIVENLQRKDLNAIEKALSFRRYLTEHQATQEELASRLKIDRSTIANLMRILELPPAIQEHVSHNRISAGHARAILPLGEEREQMEFCNRIIAEGWSVREAERRVAEYINRQDGPAVKPKRKVGNPQVEMLESQAKRALGTAVQIKANGRGAGRMIIHFKNDAEFQRIFEQVCQERGALAKVA